MFSPLEATHRPDLLSEGKTMDLKYARCCGLDVHNATVVACFREVREDGAVVRKEEQFTTPRS